MNHYKQTSLFTFDDSIIIKYGMQFSITIALIPFLSSSVIMPSLLPVHIAPHTFSSKWARTGPASGAQGLMDNSHLLQKQSSAKYRCDKVDYSHETDLLTHVQAHGPEKGRKGVRNYLN